MSYWISLIDEDGNVAEVKPFEEGGTYAVGGSSEADLNVTYNYGQVYHLLDFSIRDLHEKKAQDTIELLESLVKKLGTHKYKDYWAATPGNAGFALSVLLSWARQYPQYTWNVN